MIRVRLAPAAGDRIEVACSPLTECLLSLRLLRRSRRHRFQQPWARAMRRLPPSLLGPIDRLALLLGDEAPVFVAAGGGRSMPFAAELELLCSMPPTIIRHQFTRGLHHGRVTRAQLDRPSVRRRIREAVSQETGVVQEELHLVLEQPHLFLAWVSELISDYFERAFVKEWERIEPLLADCVAEARRRIASEGLYEALPSLSARLRGDPRRSEILIEEVEDSTWTLHGDDLLVLAPSVYAWPNLLIRLDDRPWPKGIIYPAPFLADRTVEPLPPAELLRLLRALGDNTRLSVLRLIAERPRSTQELAPLVGVSEATLSRHLRLLTQTGVLRRRRDGRFVVYSLHRERLGQLEPSLLRYLRRQDEEA